MSDKSFIDTNVLIYQLDTSDSRKHTIAERIIRTALHEQTACISFQVVQECLNVVLRKAEVKLSVDQARIWLDTVLTPLHEAAPEDFPGPHLYHRALDVQERYGFSFYDSLIIASALEAGCTRLLTEDMQHEQRIETLTIQNPFVA